MKTTAAVQQAIMWEVRLREGDAGKAVLCEFERWLAASPSHELAWDALQARLSRMGGASSPDAAAFARALRTPSIDRRRALRAAFGLLALGVGGWGALQGAQQLGLDADWRSAVGERGEGAMADGTPLVYDAASHIYLSGSAGSPVLDLRQGQLLLKAWPQQGRMLSISTAHGMVATAGATLNVGRMRERSVVSLSAGSALLRLPGRTATSLEAGQTAYFSAQGVEVADLSFDAASAWTRGILVADRLPLADLLDVFGRYRGGLLRATGRAAAQQISGVFRLDDIDRALLQVSDTLPVRVTRYGRYLAILS
jgi:transmembrane sensor